MSESLALARIRARRRPPKPPGSPSPWPWWFTALVALLNLTITVQALAEHKIVWAAFQGALFLITGNWAVCDWQWHRYNRWKGGRS